LDCGGHIKYYSNFLNKKGKRKMLNTITICGRICNELELKTTQSGTEVISFAVACERDFKNGNGEKEADFIDVIAFGKTAVFVSQYFGKGRMIIVDGRLQTRNWEDKNGNKRKSVEVIANSVYFADSKTNTETASQAAPNFETIPDDGELPF
jgi:single-strand DNA-binding protein